MISLIVPGALEFGQFTIESIVFNRVFDRVDVVAGSKLLSLTG